jgi:hypothetical protein
MIIFVCVYNLVSVVFNENVRDSFGEGVRSTNKVEVGGPCHQKG